MPPHAHPLLLPLLLPLPCDPRRVARARGARGSHTICGRIYQVALEREPRRVGVDLGCRNITSEGVGLGEHEAPARCHPPTAPASAARPRSRSGFILEASVGEKPLARTNGENAGRHARGILTARGSRCISAFTTHRQGHTGRKPGPHARRAADRAERRHLASDRSRQPARFLAPHLSWRCSDAHEMRSTHLRGCTALGLRT